MGSKWYHAVPILSQALIFVLVFFGRNIEKSSNASLLVTVMYGISKAAGTMIHVNIALLMLVNCVSCTWLLRKAFGYAFDPAPPILLSIFAFSVLHMGTYVAVPAVWSVKNDSIENGSGFAIATLKAGVGWSGIVMLLLLTSIVSAAMFLAVEGAPVWQARWSLNGFAVALFALMAAHEAFRVPDWSDGSFIGASDTFGYYWSGGAMIMLLESIVLKVRPQRKARILKINEHPNRVFEIQFEKLAFRPTAGQWIILDCPKDSMFKKYRLALTSAPEDDYLSVHILASDHSIRSLTSSLDFTGRQPGMLEGCQSPSVDLAKPFQHLPHLFINELFGVSCETVFNSHIAILVGVNSGVLPLASMLKSIWYRMNSPRKAMMVETVYFFWICDNLENFKWFQSLLMAIEAGNVSIEIYLYLRGPFDEAKATKHLINSAVNRMDLMTGLRNPARHGHPDWRQIFADIAENHGKMDSEAHIIYSGPEDVRDSAKNIRNEARMSGLGGVGFTKMQI